MKEISDKNQNKFPLGIFTDGHNGIYSGKTIHNDKQFSVDDAGEFDE